MNADVRVDLYSDTVTKPTLGMRRAMFRAEVGDEQKGEDPSTNRLVEMVCELLGKKSGVFLPSGTMCNEISFGVHCRPGEVLLLDESAHALHFEGGSPAAMSGIMVQPLRGVHGVFTGDQVRAAIRPASRYTPRAAAVSVEQASNLGGGRCWSLDEIRDVTATAAELKLGSHLDGARLLNAAVATGHTAREFAEGFDSAWIDLSKGLGAPVGAVLTGSAEFIEEAWRLKQRWGGAMRQSGILAAAGIYALLNHVSRLSDDHDNAKALANGIGDHPGVVLDVENVQTNIVLWDLRGADAGEFTARLLSESGVRLSVMGTHTVRAVTHLGVSRDDIAAAIAAIRALLDRLYLQ